MANKHINIGVGLTFDKNSLNTLKNELQTIQKMTIKDFTTINPNVGVRSAVNQLRDLKTSADLVRGALTNAFNTDLGTVNITKLRSELNKIDIARVYKNFQKAGATGVNAFNSLSSATLRANLQLKESHQLLGKMAETMSNTVKWGVTSSIFNSMTGSIQKAWNYTKELDNSLNDIRIVTTKSADEMDRFARNANKVARSLGKTTKDFADASLIYYQQGYDDVESQKRAEVTLKTANVTGQSTAEVSEQLTAVWNGYKVQLADTEKYVDKLAAVAATTAADLEELSTGMSKVASAASIMGVDIDQLSATLATVVSVTRQAPESVGTAFKTIYARMGDIKAGIDSETTLDAYTQQMLDVGGINVLDANNELRDMGEVIEEVGEKWSSMSREQQVALSQVMAGTRQYNNLLALFDNWSMYTDALDVSKKSLGTLQMQQDIYMESTAAHLEQLEGAWERVWNSAVDTKSTNSLIDILTGLTNTFANLIESIGGGGNALLAFGSIATRVFHKQIASSINTSIKNYQAVKYNTQQLKEQMEALEKIRKEAPNDKGTEVRYNAKQEMQKYIGNLSNEQILEYNKIIDDYGTAVAKEEEFNRRRVLAQEFITQNLKNGHASITEIESIMKGDLFTPIGESFSATVEQTKLDIDSIQSKVEEYLQAYQKYNREAAVTFKNKSAAEMTRDKGHLTKADIDGDVGLYKEAQRVKVSYDGLKKTIKELISDNNGLSTATKEYLESAYSALEKIDTKSKAYRDGTAQLEGKLKSVQNFAQKAFDSYEEGANETLRVLDEESQDGGKAAQAYREAAEEKEKLWQIKDKEAIQITDITSIVDTVSAIQSLISAVMTLQNLGNIWDDSTLSTGEKVLQTIMAVTSAVGMTTMGVMNLMRGLSVLKTTILTSMSLEIMALKIRNQLLAEGFTLEQANTAAKGMTAKMTNLSTMATWKEIVALAAKKALMVGGVLLAIGAVVAATYALVKAYNADAEAARVAGEAASEAADNYDKAAQKAQELKETISDYSDGIEQLKELTVGTEEYKEALEEANEKARELIETYGLYNDYYMKDGVITFNDGVLDQLQQEVDLQKQRAENIKYSSRMLADQAQLRSDRTNLRREITDDHGLNTAGNIATLGLNKLLDVSLVPMSDHEIDYIVKSLNNLSESQYKNVTQSDKAFQNWVKTISQGDLSLSLLSKQIGENREGFIALAKSTKDATESQKYYISQMNMGAIQQKYGENLTGLASDVRTGELDAARYNQILSIVNDSDIQERIKQQELDAENAWRNTSANLAGDKWTDPEAWGHEWEQAIGGVFTSASTNLNTMVTDNLKGIGVTESQLQDIIGTSHLNSNEDLARAYAKMSGIDVSKATWKGNKFEDDAGNVLVDVDSREARMTKRAAIFNEVRQTATREGLQAQGEAETESVINILDKAISTARQNGQKYGTDFSAGMLNALQSGEFNFENIYDRLDPDEVTELIGKSDEEILAMLGMTAQQLESLGEMSAEQFANAFRAGFENYSWDMDKALTAAMTARDEEIDTLGLSKNKTEDYKESLQDYGAHIMRIAKDSKEFSDSLDKNADAAVAVGLSILQLNDGIDALADGFDDWSDVLKKSTKESEEYSEALNNMQDALSLVYGVEKDYISNDFVVKHLDEIKKVAEGSEEAIENLRHELTEDIIISIATYNGLDQSVQNDLLDLVDELEKEIPDIKVGTEIELNGETYQKFLNTMQDIINTAGLTADQANALFSTMGFETNFATEEKDIEQTSPNTVTETTVKGYTSGTAKRQDGTEQEWEYPILSTSTYQDGTSKHTGKMTVMAMTTGADGKTKVPQINSIVKKGTGAQNNYSSKNKGGGKPGSKKSGGSSKPDSMDKVDKTPDRYHKVDTQLTKIGNNLSKIQSQEKKLTGADLIANINNQLDQLDARLDRLREKQQIAQGEAAELRDSLSGQGVKFNDDGTIANYMEIYNAKVKYVNDLINKYNSMSKDEQEKYKETVEQAKNDLDKFTEDLDRYDELVSDTIPGLGNEIQDAIDEEIELNIKKFNLEFDIRLNLKDATKDWNEFKKRILDGIDEDDIYGNAAARLNDDLSNVAGENGLEASKNRVDQVLAELKEMDETGKSDVYGDDRVKALEDLKAAYETVNEDLIEIDQIQKDVHQAWLDTMDEINEKMADQVAMYEQISNLIEHDMKIIELVYGESDYEALGHYYEKQHQNNLGLLDFQRQNADFWKKEMDSIVDKNSEEWKKARDNWISATNDLNATIETSIENARDKMENAIDKVFDKFNDEITNGKGLDYLAQQWDLVNDNADDYLDTVNAAFGIRQLESKYQDAIDATDNVSSQRKLNELMEKELKALREKDKLSEYDVERANMKYEIALKQIALEEAQQTKNTMRLRRDSQGNYRYEYVADEDAISKLQDELDVLENSLYNFDKDRWTEMQNQVVDAVQERQDAIKEIMMDASLTEEERAERLVEINRLYNEKIQNITDQTVEAQKNLYESGTDELEKDFGELSAEQGRIMVEEMLPQFNTGVNEMIDKFSGPGGFEDVTVQSIENLSAVTQEYKDDLKEIETAADTSFDNIEAGIDKNIPKTEEFVKDNKELNDEYETQIKNIKDLNKQLDEQIKNYEEITKAAREATIAAYEYWAEQQRQDAAAAEDAKTGKDNGNTGGDSGNSGGNSGGTGNTDKTGSGAGAGNGTPDVGEYATYIGGTYYSTSSGQGSIGQRGPGKRVKITAIAQGAAFPIHVMSNDSAYGWLKKSQLSGYDTGGYTGEWAGGYGKLAMLHSKELVLNAHDTENMLNMMQIARDVIALAGPRAGILSAGQGANATAGQLEQNVHIEANFPNVESASEIEEALNNLVQLASQRANRNTRG